MGSYCFRFPVANSHKICNANFVLFITAVKRTWNIVRVVSTFARAYGFSLRRCLEKNPAIRFFEIGINLGYRISISLKPCAIESRNSFVNSARRWERSPRTRQTGWIYYVSASSGHCPSSTKKCFTPHRRTSSVADNSQQRQYSCALWPRWWSQKLSHPGLYKKFLTSWRFLSSFCAWLWDLFSSFLLMILK